jgi:hypothetical protein
MYDYTQDNLSVTNGCYTCMLAQQICDPCADEQDARLTDRAWDIVDEGNDVYRWQLSRKSDEPSGHDWVSAHVYLIRPAIQIDGTIREIREEFLEPTSLLSDRLFDMDIEVPVGSTVCADCHYVCNKSIACPNCELVNN